MAKSCLDQSSNVVPGHTVIPPEPKVRAVGTIPEDRSINTTIQSSNAVPGHIVILPELKVRAVGTIPEDRFTTRVRVQYLYIS